MKKAHSPDKNRQDNVWHDLVEHLESVAARVASYSLGPDDPLNDLCQVIALCHDVGKASDDWQRYVIESYAGMNPASVNHTDAGAYYLAQKGAEYAPLAMMVARHHGGFELCDRDVCLQLKQAYPKSKARIDQAIAYAESHLTIPTWVPSPKWVEMSQDPVRHMIACHMAHSRLVDADCMDTHLFYENDYTPYCPDLTTIQAQFDAYIAELEKSNNPLRDLRRDLRLEVTGKALLEKGMYSATMPTGSGKTLTLMSHALAHIAHHKMDRVIVVAPFINIIQQNAEVYRKCLGNVNVLEHHSNVPDLDSLTANRWDRFCILTSNVQFFETLFASRNSQMRKTRNIANSVIILDEVQNLPCDLLNVTLKALQALVTDWGCTVVFCTATQPAVGPQHLKNSPLQSLVELVDDPAKYFQVLRRVEYRYESTPKTHAEVAACLRQERQVLCILNTIKDAQTITALMPDSLHLSSHMTPKHRMCVLAEIHKRLDEGLPCTVVSTQVVEAGVDIDFPKVWRVFGPLEAIIQTAGRCNREGSMSVGEVRIFELVNSRSAKGFYKASIQLTRMMLAMVGEAAFLDLLHDPHFLTKYYKELYRKHDTDARDILQLIHKGQWGLVADQYKLIDDITMSVIVLPPIHDPDRAAVDQMLGDAQGLLTARIRHDLKPYTLSVFGSRYKGVEEKGWITAYQCPLRGKARTPETLRVLDPQGYDPLMGVIVE